MSNSSLISYTNLTKNHSNGRGGKKISTIIIHHMASKSTAKQCADYFASTKKMVSANYTIGYDGDIALSVSEENRSWCSGKSIADNPAITIECANDDTTKWTVSDKTIKSLINLCADVCKRNGIKELTFTGDTKGNLQAHRMWDATFCPGDYLYGKLPYIAEQVNAILNPTTDTSNTVYTIQCGAFKSKKNADALCEQIKKSGFDCFVTVKGDMNGDGKVTAADAQIVLNKSVGK